MSKRPEEILAESLQAAAKEIEMKAHEPSSPPPVRMVTQKNLFAHPDTHPVALDFALLRAFQAAWFSWLPDTLFSEIEQTFKTSINEVNKTKIMATKTLHVVDSFWEEWEVFEKTIMALNGIVPRISVMQPADVSQLLIGVETAHWIRKEEFSDEVSRYTAACFLYENVHYAPPPCEYAQKYISQPKYLCHDCHKVGSALPPFDGYCDSCSQKFEQIKSFSLKPDPDKLHQEHGQSVSYNLTFDPQPVKQRFEELDKTPAEKMRISETDVDIQAAKLIVAIDLKRFRHNQLIEQLTSLRSWLEGA